MYLINSVIKEDNREKYLKMIKEFDLLLQKFPHKREEMFRKICPIILANDFEGCKFANLRERFKMKYKYDIK